MDNERVFRVCKSYLGTPFVNTGRIRGAGVDCSTFPKMVMEELTGKEFPMPTKYSADWMCKRDCEEIMLPYLEAYCDRVDDLRVGDIISFRWGRAQFAHQAIYVGNNLVFHCRALTGVEMTELSAPYFYDSKGESRITGYWRVRE